MIFIISIFLSITTHADSLQGIANVMEDQAHAKKWEVQQEEWDLKFCIERASFARQVVIPQCRLKPSANCPLLLFHFYRAKCERWGL